MPLHPPRFAGPPKQANANRKEPVDEPGGKIPHRIFRHQGAITLSKALTDASTPKVTDASGSILKSGE